MVKCVVFDFDGTLVNSNVIKEEAFYKIVYPWDSSGEVVAEVFERWPAADRYEKTRKIAKGLITRKLLPEDSSIAHWGARLAEDYTAYCESAITNCAEMPGASQTLAELSEMGMLLYVNSGTPTKPLLRLLELRNWIHYFRGAYGVEASKADNLKNVALDSGAARHEIVHVGDQLDDMRGAKQFGCHFVAMAVRGAESTVRENSLLLEDLRCLPGLVTKISRETP
jgi:phosphoglycolate phosphatase